MDGFSVCGVFQLGGALDLVSRRRSQYLAYGRGVDGAGVVSCEDSLVSARVLRNSGVYQYGARIAGF